MALLRFTPQGIYCPVAGFYIDPWRPVARAIVTHAHADHAYPGMGSYLAHRHSAEVLRLRLGAHIGLQVIDYNKIISINGVEVSLHPAGHVPGSAQVKVSHKGETWVVSGDYKTEADGLSAPFEPVRCHTFISECTFGMPVFDWKPSHTRMNEIRSWWQHNAEAGKTSVLFAYSLGKAQRLQAGLGADVGPVLLHGSIANTTEALEREGFTFPSWKKVGPDDAKETTRKALVIAPPSAQGTAWMKKFEPYETATCSGWMAIRGFKRRSNLDRGFVVSDHADWKGLLSAIEATGAEKIFVTHGYTAPFARYLTELGKDAAEVKTNYGLEEDNTTPTTP